MHELGEKQDKSSVGKKWIRNELDIGEIIINFLMCLMAMKNNVNFKCMRKYLEMNWELIYFKYLRGKSSQSPTFITSL
jgi:hypothetical protein